MLVMLALSSLIGSGWLFGSWEAARVAGPAAILSWIIGAAVIMTIAFTYIELGTMFPESGGMSHYAQYSHGALLGFIAAWANWFSLVTIIPIEAVAAVQYMASWPWSWAKPMHSMIKNGQITNQGLLVVFAFIVIFTLLNYWSIKLLTRFTSLIAVFKLVIPLLTVVVLSLSGFYPQNFGHSFHTIFPYGTAAVFSATTAAGIIFSYNAFQTVINLGGEIENPRKNIQRGINISLTISAVIYILLQITFIGAIKPSLLARVGWHGINFQSPFADLAILMGIHWLTVLLYIDAFVSPFGTGVSFVASTSRSLSAMANNHMPSVLGRLNKIYHTPRLAMVVNAVVSMFLVSIFRSWSTLASVISTSTLIAYLTGPVTVMSLREMGPDLNRPVKSKWMPLMAFIAYELASLAIYWAMWPTTVEVILVIVLGLPIYFWYEAKTHFKTTWEQLKSCLWLLGELAFLTLISYFGSHEFGGVNLIRYPLDFGMIVIGSALFYWWGLHSWVKSPDYDTAVKINEKI